MILLGRWSQYQCGITREVVSCKEVVLESRLSLYGGCLTVELLVSLLKKEIPPCTWTNEEKSASQKFFRNDITLDTIGSQDWEV